MAKLKDPFATRDAGILDGLTKMFKRKRVQPPPLDAEQPPPLPPRDYNVNYNKRQKPGGGKPFAIRDNELENNVLDTDRLYTNLANDLMETEKRYTSPAKNHGGDIDEFQQITFGDEATRDTFNRLIQDRRNTRLQYLQLLIKDLKEAQRHGIRADIDLAKLKLNTWMLKQTNGDKRLRTLQKMFERMDPSTVQSHDSTGRPLATPGEPQPVNTNTKPPDAQNPNQTKNPDGTPVTPTREELLAIPDDGDPPPDEDIEINAALDRAESFFDSRRDRSVAWYKRK